MPPKLWKIAQFNEDPASLVSDVLEKRKLWAHFSETQILIFWDHTHWCAETFLSFCSLTMMPLAISCLSVHVLPGKVPLLPFLRCDKTRVTAEIQMSQEMSEVVRIDNGSRTFKEKKSSPGNSVHCGWHLKRQRNVWKLGRCLLFIGKKEKRKCIYAIWCFEGKKYREQVDMTYKIMHEDAVPVSFLCGKGPRSECVWFWVFFIHAESCTWHDTLSEVWWFTGIQAMHV